jgi:allantoinase
LGPAECGLKAHVDFGIWGIYLGDLNMKDLIPLNKAGVISFKFFWGYAINSNTNQLMYNYKDGDEGVIPPLADGEDMTFSKKSKRQAKYLLSMQKQSDYPET